MCKLGGSGLTPKNWRRRWFVLKDKKLYYYKTAFVSCHVCTQWSDVYSSPTFLSFPSLFLSSHVLSHFPLLPLSPLSPSLLSPFLPLSLPPFSLSPPSLPPLLSLPPSPHPPSLPPSPPLPPFSLSHPSLPPPPSLPTLPPSLPPSLQDVSALGIVDMVGYTMEHSPESKKK